LADDPFVASAVQVRYDVLEDWVTVLDGATREQALKHAGRAFRMVDSWGRTPYAVRIIDEAPRDPRDESGLPPNAP